MFALPPQSGHYSVRVCLLCAKTDIGLVSIAQCATNATHIRNKQIHQKKGC